MRRESEESALSSAEHDPATPDPDSSSPRSKSSRLPLFLTIAVVLLVVDQITKMLAIELLADSAPIDLIPGFLSLTLVFNPGAAFGLGSGMTIILTLVALAVCVVVARVARKLRDGMWTVALALLLSGALGNLIDRVFRQPAPFRGHVVDFINYNGWFVGNVADIALTVAAVMMVWRTWQGVMLDGTRESDGKKNRGDATSR